MRCYQINIKKFNLAFKETQDGEKLAVLHGNFCISSIENMGSDIEENYSVKFVARGIQKIDRTCFLDIALQIILVMKIID